MLPKSIKIAELVKACQAFNSRYGEMERVLWALAERSREDLLRNEYSTVVEEFVWTIKSWWGIQGVRREMKQIAAEALLRLEWRPDLSVQCVDHAENGESFAIQRVGDLVQELQKLGALRREWSLASKALHWLLPWRIPVYDSFVKRCLRLPSQGDPKRAYSQIVHWEYDVARRLLTRDERWLGNLEPKSPFRALDKYLWWKEGGERDTAAVVKDPWRVIRRIESRI